VSGATAPRQLTLHADRGSSMASKPVALLLSDLGVTKTHSRPHVSNDNPYSERQFETLDYRPSVPDRFRAPEPRAATAGTSSIGTTSSTVTAASACSRRPTAVWINKPQQPGREPCMPAVAH